MILALNLRQKENLKAYLRHFNFPYWLCFFPILLAPTQSFKFAGISFIEWSVLLIVTLFTIFNKKVLISKTIGQFIIFFTLLAAFAQFVSLITFINEDYINHESMIYDSDLGYLFRIIRYYIMFMYAVVLCMGIYKKRIKPHSIFAFYICITTLLFTAYWYNGNLRLSHEPSGDSFYCIMSIFFCVALIDATQSRVKKIIYYGIILFHIASIFLHLQSTGGAVVVISWLFYEMLWKFKAKGVALIILFLVGFVVLLSFDYQYRGKYHWLWVIKYKFDPQHVLNPTRTSSTQDRFQTAMSSIKMSAENPAGVGLGNFGWHGADYADLTYAYLGKHGSFGANNSYATILSELGYGGMLLLCWLILRVIRMLKFTDPGLRHSYGALFTGLMANALALNIFSSVQFWFALGIISVAELEKGQYLKIKRPFS